MIIDMHVHPMFQEIVQSLSTTPQGRQLINNLDETSKTPTTEAKRSYLWQNMKRK